MVPCPAPSPTQPPSPASPRPSPPRLSITRAELSRTDLEGVPDMEVVIADLTIAPGAHVPKHEHHGSERRVGIEGGIVLASSL